MSHPPADMFKSNRKLLDHGRRPALLLAAGLLLSSLMGCGSEDDGPEDAITIGLLLPFTGTTSATASNFERAVIYATDRINQAGGIQGHQVRVVSADTHSDSARSLRSTEKLLAAHPAVVLGVESTDIAGELLPVFLESETLFLSPFVGAASEQTLDCAHPWFRLAPSAKSLGEALAKQVAAEKIERVATLYAAGAYNEALGDAVKRRFATALEIELNPNAQSYSGVIGRAIDAQVDAVVLATSPRAGALVINEFDALSAKRPRWFLSPLLKTELLVQNVAPEALEGAQGIAPKIFDRSADFPQAFAKRWLGDQALEGAYFYYDAVGVVAFALARATVLADGSVDHESLHRAMLEAAAPPGEAAGWNELEQGLARQRDGADVYYSGLTGPLLLESCGARRLGVTSTWQIQGGAIVTNTD
jgi:ABC-type branched-subunit amino acid transport system substrate-binding protein